jgi:hypothetical protein
MQEDIVRAPLSRQTRIRLIGERGSTPQHSHMVLFQGRYREFPVTKVPNEALVYRVENGRLAAELEEHAAATGVSVEEFRRGAETMEVQQHLHRLLVAKAKDSHGPIFAELERLGQQTEPLLVLFDGVVINGNRRLAAMRELARRDVTRYAAFSEVAVAVLPPDTEPQEIEYVEAALQMAPETKLQYGWLDRRLKLRKQREVLRLPVEHVMAAYRIDNPADIAREIAELALAEYYLKDYRQEPARYSRIADAGELFIGLQKQLSELPKPQKEFWCLAGFALIDGRDASTANQLQRLFPFAPPVPADLPSVAARRLAQRFGVETADRAGDGELSHSEVHDLMAIFRDKRNSVATSRSIADVLDELRLEHNDRRAPERMLQKVREAGQLIARLEPERLSPEQRRRLRGDLAALQAHAAYIMGGMEEKPVVPALWNYPKKIIRPPYRKIPWRIMRRMGWSRPSQRATPGTAERN